MYTDHDDLFIPYFVYGTLKPGFGNDWLWREVGATDVFDGRCFAPEYALWSRSIPYAVPIDEAVKLGGDDIRPAHGTLLIPPRDEFLAIRMRDNLDGLEGHPAHYFRTKTIVFRPNATLTAWIYSWPHDTWKLNPDRLITDGIYRY